MTLTLWEKEGRVGLEIVGVSTDGVTGLDVTGESSERATDLYDSLGNRSVDVSLGDLSGFFEEELDFPLVKPLDVEIGEGTVDASTCDNDDEELALLNLLTPSLCTCSKDNSNT